MQIDPELFCLLFGALQLIVVGLATWTLTTVIKQGNRITKMETMMESSLIADIKDLKQRVRDVEVHCKSGSA
jgi:hypothetical protein